MEANPHRRSIAARAAVGVTVATFLTLGSGAAKGQPVATGDAGPIFCSADSDCGNPYLACAPAQVFSAVMQTRARSNRAPPTPPSARRPRRKP